MVHSISQKHSYEPQPTSSTPQAPKPPAEKTPQDTVSLSSQAKSGGAQHESDSN